MSELTTRTCPACGAPVAGPGVCAYCGAQVHAVGAPVGDPSPSHATPAWVVEARECVANRRKIQAIKVVRQNARMSLKEAKDFVESGGLDDPAQLAHLLR